MLYAEVVEPEKPVEEEKPTTSTTDDAETLGEKSAVEAPADDEIPKPSVESSPKKEAKKPSQKEGGKKKANQKSPVRFNPLFGALRFLILYKSCHRTIVELVL